MLLLGTDETTEKLGKVLDELNQEVRYYEDIVNSKKKMAEKIACLIGISIKLGESTRDLEWVETKLRSMEILNQPPLDIKVRD